MNTFWSCRCALECCRRRSNAGRECGDPTAGECTDPGDVGVADVTPLPAPPWPASHPLLTQRVGVELLPTGRPDHQHRASLASVCDVDDDRGCGGVLLLLLAADLAVHDAVALALADHGQLALGALLDGNEAQACAALTAQQEQAELPQVNPAVLPQVDHTHQPRRLRPRQLDADVVERGAEAEGGDGGVTVREA